MLDRTPEEEPQQESTFASLMRSRAFKFMVVAVLATVGFKLILGIWDLIPHGNTRVLTDGGATIRQEPLELTVKYLGPGDWNINRKFGEAFTHWSYIAKTDFDLALVQESPPHNYLLQIRKVNVDLSLPVTMWLPYGVSDKLHKHEDGHWRICQRVYDDAAKEGLKYAKSMVGKSFMQIRPNVDDAKVNAAHQAHVQFESQYRRQSEDVANKISQLYDDITHHGLNEITPEQGITMAINKYDDLRRQGVKVIPPENKSSSQEQQSAASKGSTAKSAAKQRGDK
jgi:hypothetical protein